MYDGIVLQFITHINKKTFATTSHMNGVLVDTSIQTSTMGDSQRRMLFGYINYGIVENKRKVYTKQELKNSLVNIIISEAIFAAINNTYFYTIR